MATKKRQQNKLSKQQKAQLRKLLSIVRKFPRKKKISGLGRGIGKAGKGTLGELNALKQGVASANAGISSLATQGTFLASAAGQKAFQQMQQIYADAVTRLQNFLAQNPQLVGK